MRASSSHRTKSLDNSLWSVVGRSSVSLSASSSSMEFVVASSSSSSLILSGTLSLDLGSRWVAFSSKSCISTSAIWNNLVIREGWIRAPVQRSWLDSIIPYSITWPTPN